MLYDPNDKPDEIDDLLRLLGVRRAMFTLATALGQVGLYCLVAESGCASTVQG